MQQLRGTDLKRLNRTWRRRGGSRLGLVLEGIASPFNVGAMVRTSAVMGVGELYLVTGTASPRSSKAQKTAMGTDRYLRWREYDDLAAAVGAARSDGFRIVGLELADEAKPLADLDLVRDVCLLVGHEDRGITPAGLALCDDVGYIPQLGRVGSLNVATATAIACYEVRRQGFAANDSTMDPSDVDDEDLDE